MGFSTEEDRNIRTKAVEWALQYAITPALVIKYAKMYEDYVSFGKITADAEFPLEEAASVPREYPYQSASEYISGGTGPMESATMFPQEKAKHNPERATDPTS